MNSYFLLETMGSDQWAGSIHSSPNIFVKLLREDVGADLPFNTLTDFENRSHISGYVERMTKLGLFAIIN